MSYESPSLLLLATGADANKRLTGALAYDSYDIVDLSTVVTRVPDQNGVLRPDHQVVILGNIPLPVTGHDAMNACLEFMHDLQAMARSRGVTIETLLLTRQAQSGGPDTLPVGLLLPRSQPLNYSQRLNLEELTLTLQDVLQCQRMKETTRQKPLLERLMEGSAALLSERSRSEVLQRILQVVRESGFDRARLYLLSDDGQILRGEAQAGMKDLSFEGVEWPVATDYHFQQLLAARQPLLFHPTSDQPEHSEEKLDKADLTEWVSVPLLLRDQVIGQLSADNKFTPRLISESELEPLKLFAALAAAAIEKADLIEKAERRARQLETLQRTTLAITSTPSLERPNLLGIIIAQAVELLQAKSGGLYEYQEERGRLILVADHNRQDFVGQLLLAGEGVAGRLVLSGEPFRIIENYNTHPDRAAIFESQRHFGAVLEVPLRWQTRTIGVLYVDDAVGRRFTPEDARLLSLFADQAANVLFNHSLLAADEEKLNRLEKLSHSTTEIMGNLGKLKRHELLMMVARHATEILAAETCGISLVKQEGVLSLEANYGHNGSIKRGQLFPIGSGNQTGLTGHIAYQGRLFNAFGEDLIRHQAVRNPRNASSPSGNCHSVLAIPLRNHRAEVIGLLRADNKVGEDGLPHPTLAFTKEDEWIMNIFAEVVTVCVQNARLVEQLRNQKERLIDNLPHAIIAVDMKGRVTDFSGQAERIHSYRKDEVLDQDVKMLYKDGEPRRIGKLLRESADGKIVEVEATVKNRDGELIPVRLSASNLYDEEGKPIGSIGYFEDIRLLKEYQRRLELILQASNLVAQAEDLTSGLQSLAKMLVSLFPDNFCLIALFDESGSRLVAKAGASRTSKPAMDSDWRAPVGEQYNVANYPGLIEMLRDGKPTKLKYSQERHRKTLEQVHTTLGLPQPIQSLLMIPLRLGERLLGLLSLIELCAESKSQFTKENMELAAAIASQSTVLVDRIQSAERSREKLFSFYEVSSRLKSQRDPEQLLDALVGETIAASGACHIHLVLIDERERVQNSLSVPECGPLTVRADGISMQVFRTGRAEIIPDTDKQREQLNPPQQIDVKAAVCLPLSLPHKRIGVMWLDYDCPRHFSESEVAALQLYVNQAAMAYENAQERQRLERLRIAADALARVNETGKVQQQILASAREILQADAVVLWLFDNERDTFIPDRSLANRIPSEIWDKYRASGPNNGGTAHRLLEQFWLAINDLADRQERESLGALSRALLAEYGARAFQGVAIRVGAEKLGVIYALYQHPRSFGDKERRTALNFARNAALTMKKAKLIEQVSAINTVAKAVAKSIVFGDRQATLQSIVEEAQKASGCDAVVLFEYEQDKRLLRQPMVVGVRQPKEMFDEEKDSEHRLVYKLLEEAQPRVVDHLAAASDFKDRSFAYREKIQSCIAIPLFATGQKVGVMFFNYRRRRRFTTEEVGNVQFFADQAAVAIRYAQFAEDKAEKLKQQESLVRLSGLLRNAPTLQTTMDVAVDITATLMRVECCNIVLPGQDGILTPRAHFGWPEELVAGLKLPAGRGSQSGYTMLKQRPVIVGDYQTEKHFEFPREVLARGVKSGLSVPMMRGEEIIGAMLVYTTTPRHFSEEDSILLQLIANQTAVAIRSTERYEQLERRNANLRAVHNASKAITKSFGLEQEVLDEIVRQAAEGVTNVSPLKAAVATLQLYDETQNTLVLNSIYPMNKYPNLTKHVGHKWSLDKTKAQDNLIGITGRTILEKKSQCVGDVLQDQDYLPFNEETCSELSVPMCDGDKLIGAINVESHHFNGFDEDDQKALETLAEHAVITIKNARQFEELKDTKLQIGARTALAWMGMANNAWRHVIARDAAEIGNRATLIRELIKREGIGQERIAEHLEQIELLVKSIHEKPITAPLSSEEGVAIVNINDLATERINQLRQNSRYSSIHLEACPSAEQPLTVLASSEWLRRALDILVDNAADAVKPLEEARQIITVTTNLQRNKVEIRVADLGYGIPEEIKPLLFKTRVEQSQGFGMGLLIAQAIVETYGGKIELDKSDKQGTVMVIRLPHKP